MGPQHKYHDSPLNHSAGVVILLWIPRSLTCATATSIMLYMDTFFISSTSYSISGRAPYHQYRQSFPLST